MKTREDAINYCKSFENVMEDYPFSDHNYTLMRHKAGQKAFACIYNHEGNIWINVKCDPEWRDFWRNAYESIVPGFHMNKKHWNSIILDDTVPEKDIKRMIAESYELTRPRQRKGGKK